MKNKIADFFKNKKMVAISAACFAVVIVTVVVVCVVSHNKKVAAANNTTVPASEETTLIETTTVIETTAGSTTEAETTTEKVASPVTKKNAATTQATLKKQSFPVSFLVTGPVPFPSKSDGGFSVSDLNAGNMREDPKGGYMFDVWGTLYNNKHNDSRDNKEINAKIDFYVSTMDENSTGVAHGVLDAGVLQPDENKYVVTTVHVDEYSSYMVRFSINSWG